MKLKLLLLACLTQAILSAEELKVTTLSTQNVNYQNGIFGDTYFRILCINGYQWLHNITSGGVLQMFEMNNNNQTKPIKCQN